MLGNSKVIGANVSFTKQKKAKAYILNPDVKVIFVKDNPDKE